jgi:hypothetical protein
MRIPLKPVEEPTPITHKYACPHVMRQIYQKKKSYMGISHGNHVHRMVRIS